ncbi:ArsR/SmtB family transcription factor [Williamsia serinedens]|uniref:DNA-binding transcriptional regulator, ArsR family n=1 Tax=Williamsia serinedens TaxID=391736 RepID=A0ABT1H7V2_9NOCA|nr:helix-turn-helix domain-containing protein [Williamsia serinedens]MCP2161977.1 DNA-binding transcriptional regulator, ArsR family [Williamsia serinedens]
MATGADETALDDDALLGALKALANPVRLQIVRWLDDPHDAFAEYEPVADRDVVGVCVTHIQAKAGLAQSTVSTYMATLEKAGLVESTRVGKWTHYRRSEERLRSLEKALHDL